MSLVATHQTALLDRLFGSGAVVRIGNGADSYVGVCVSNPGETGSTSGEANYGSRRQIVAAGWNAPSSGQTANNGLVPLWVATGTATLQYFLLGDTSVPNSTHDFSRPLSSSVAVVSGDKVQFVIGSLTVAVSGLLTHVYTHDQLDMLLRNLTPTQPTDYYYGLSTTTPSPDGTGFTEPSGNQYDRVQKTRGGPFGSAVSGAPSTITNDNDSIIWPVPTGSWGTVTYWGAFDAASGGNLLLFGELDSAAAVPSGAQPSFETGDLTLTME